MAKARVGAAGIETISGALLKPKKENGHNHGNYLIATHRTAPTTNPNCQRLYSKPADAYKRNTPVTAEELAQRLRFKTVAAAVAARAKNLATISQDREDFLEQKDEPNGAKTLKAYFWRKELESYDASH